MAGTIKVKEVLRRVSVLLQDSDPQFVRHPESELVDWLNDAQRAIFTYLPAACSRIDAVRLVPGTLQSIESIPTAYCKPGDGSTPTVPVVGSMLLGVMCNMGADGLTIGNAVRAITDGREVLDTLVPNWHTATATTIVNWVYDPTTPRQFFVYPGAHASTPVWVRMAFVAQPIEIPNTGTPGSELYASGGGSTTKISVHDEHLDDLVNYCAARAQMKNAQFSSTSNAGAFAQMFTGSINAKSVALTGYNPNLQNLPFAPAPMGAAS